MARQNRLNLMATEFRMIDTFGNLLPIGTVSRILYASTVCISCFCDVIMSLSFNENRFVSVKKHESYIIINGNVPQNNSKRWHFAVHIPLCSMLKIRTWILPFYKNNKYFIDVVISLCSLGLLTQLTSMCQFMLFTCFSLEICLIFSTYFQCICVFIVKLVSTRKFVPNILKIGIRTVRPKCSLRSMCSYRKSFSMAVYEIYISNSNLEHLN